MLSKHHALTLIIGLSALLYLTLVLLADRHAVLAVLERMNATTLIVIFSLSLFNYLLRFLALAMLHDRFGSQVTALATHALLSGRLHSDRDPR